MKKTNFLAVVLFLLPCAPVFAGTARDKQDVHQSISQAAYSYKVLHQLSQAVDFWHEANLKGDDRQVAVFQQEIYSVIEEDIRVAALQVLDANKEQREAKIEAKADAQTKEAKFDDRRDYVDDVKDSNVRAKYFKSKKRILHSIKKANSFSYRYRLLNDYLELLRREVATEKIEVAEDRREAREDR